MTYSPIHLSWTDNAPPALDEDALRTALGTFLEALGHGHRGLNVLLADDPTLQDLNRRFRNLDKPTDVLSWSYPTSDGMEEEAGGLLLGEMALSLERAAAQAAENGWDLQTEVLRLLAHGCAHLVGHDHQTPAEDQAMKAVEVDLLARVGLTGVYPDDEPAAAGD